MVALSIKSMARCLNAGSISQPLLYITSLPPLLCSLNTSLYILLVAKKYNIAQCGITSFCDRFLHFIFSFYRMNLIVQQIPKIDGTHGS
jgi:hypothetical protein